MKLSAYNPLGPDSPPFRVAKPMELDSTRVAQLLAGIGPDDSSARELLPLVYDELRRLAAVHLEGERPTHTLQPTALVNEAYLRLAGATPVRVTDRRHFFRLASKVMRQVLVDHARAKAADRRGGNAEPVTLAGDAEFLSRAPIDLLLLEEAMGRLGEMSPQKARLVELRFFGGLSIEEAADALDISRTQVTREWRTARAWLADELRGGVRP